MSFFSCVLSCSSITTDFAHLLRPVLVVYYNRLWSGISSSSADSAIKNRSIAATLRFGHDGNVIPLLALLQVENFDVSVAGPAEVYKHWCDFKASPMAANIQIVFFENKKGDILVKFLHNEKEVHVAVKTDMWPYYHWNDVREYYLDCLSKL